MATDVVIERDGRLPSSPLTIRRLDAVLPSTWSKGNPVDIVSDASAQRYALAMEAILDDEQVDALLVLNCPSPSSPERTRPSPLPRPTRNGRRCPKSPSS